MQVDREPSAYQHHHHHHPASPYSMSRPHSKISQQHTPQHSRAQAQQPHYLTFQRQYPYNPYPHNDPRCSRSQEAPLYILRDHTTTTAAGAATSATFSGEKSSSDQNDPLAPPQDMFFELERLLMGISPFPPSIPRLAKPTCPPLDDQTMTELSSSVSSLSSSGSPSASASAPCSSSSSPASASSSKPLEALNEQSFSALEHYYRKQEQRSELSQQKQLDRHHSFQQHNQYRQPHGSDHSARSISPSQSPFSTASSICHSPNIAIDSGHDLPYWSPSTPSLQVDHEWSNQSSPLVPSLSQPTPSTESTTVAQPSSPSSSSSSPWGYPLFEQMSMSLPMSGLGGGCVAPSSSHSSCNNNSNDNNNSPMMYSASSNNTITRRAARTLPHSHRPFVSDLSGFSAYQSTAHYAYTHHNHRHHHHNHHYRRHLTASSSGSTGAAGPSNNNNSSSSSSSSSSGHQGQNQNQNQNHNSSNNHHHHSHGHSAHTGTSASAIAHATVATMTRGGAKLYSCPTCTKSFPTRTQLKSHMAIHIDNFPFPCLYTGCDLHFKRKHDLRRHVDAKHALVKKYLCSGGCGEGFGRRDQMIRHLRRGHCGRMFMQATTTTTITE